MKLEKDFEVEGFSKEFYSIQVGDGKDIFLWLDRWHPNGVLLEKYGFWLVYEAGSRNNAKLESMIKNKEWNWLPARSEDMVEVQSKLGLVSVGYADIPGWQAAKNGLFSCSAT